MSDDALEEEPKLRWRSVEKLAQENSQDEVSGCLPEISGLVIATVRLCLMETNY